MRNEYLAAVAIAALVACTGLVANSLRSLPSEKQSAPNTQGRPTSCLGRSILASVWWLTGGVASNDARSYW